MSDPLIEKPLARTTPIADVLKKSRETPPAIRRLREKREQALLGGPADRVQAQKAKGKLTARERIHYLLDDGSFQEVDLLLESRASGFGLESKRVPGDGVIAGFGKMRGRDVAVFSQDFTVLGGSLGSAHARKICKVMDMAAKARIPLIGLLDSGGARIQEGVDSLDGYAEIFWRNVEYSGVIPQISVILGPCAGGAVYSPALTDFVFMVEGTSHMFVTGPEVVRAATGETVDFETLGGAGVHASKSGVCHFKARSEPDCFRQVRELVSYLPSSRWETAPAHASNDPDHRQTPLLEKFSEVDPRKPYRMHHVIWQVTDEHKFFEVHAEYAKNMVTGFARVGGEVVGIVANNPAHMAGAIDIAASEKAARFIRFLNAYNIPLLSLVDVPGYWPGREQEHAGIIKRGAKLLYAYCEAKMPKVTVVLRKAYGGAYIAMGSKYLRSDFNFALPSAEIAVMGPKGAVEILYSREIKAAQDPDALKEKLAGEYADQFASPYKTAGSGSIDEVVEPRQLRSKVVNAFRLLRNKRKPAEEPGRGNLPL